MYGRNLTSEAKKTLSDGYLKYFGSSIPPEEILPCRGCLIDGNKDCPVKSCVIENEIENCAHCPDFTCDKVISKMDVIDNIQDRSRFAVSKCT